jgi:hypothetical protein
MALSGSFLHPTGSDPRGVALIGSFDQKRRRAPVERAGGSIVLLYVVRPRCKRERRLPIRPPVPFRMARRRPLPVVAIRTTFKPTASRNEPQWPTIAYRVTIPLIGRAERLRRTPLISTAESRPLPAFIASFKPRHRPYRGTDRHGRHFIIGSSPRELGAA